MMGQTLSGFSGWPFRPGPADAARDRTANADDLALSTDLRLVEVNRPLRGVQKPVHLPVVPVCARPGRVRRPTSPRGRALHQTRWGLRSDPASSLSSRAYSPSSGPALA